jgi:hypothetical protein
MLPQLKVFHWYIDMKLIPGANGQRIQQPSCVLSLDVCILFNFKDFSRESISGESRIFKEWGISAKNRVF